MWVIISNEKNYIVYCHVFPTGETLKECKKYFGITCKDYNKRWGKHGAEYRGQKVFDAILYYGWKNITHYILFKNLTKEEAILKEQELIAKYKTNDPKYGYNASEGGETREVICLNTDKVYDNAKLAAKDYIGITTDKDIRRCCKGRIDYAGIDPITHEKLIWMKYYDYKIQLTKNKE